MTKLIALHKPVALLDEHLLTDEDGKVLFYLSPQKLQRIADNNNRRIKETGDTCPVVLGHTEEGRKEEDQPEVFGEADDFFVAPGRRDGERVVPDPRGKGKQYLFARWKIFEDRIPLLRKYPRRSVELWTSRMEIDPISLLGATTPDRDLGLVRMSDKGPSVRVRFSDHGDPQMPFDPMAGGMDQDPVATEDSNQPVTLAQLEQLDWVQFIKELMGEFAQGQQQQQAPMGEPGMEQGPPMEGQDDGGMAPPDNDGGVDDNEEEPAAEGEPLRHSAGVAPGGMDTFVPNSGKVSMSRNHEDAVRLRRLEDGSAALAEENRQLRVQLSRQVRRNDLLELEAEGVELDIGEELDAVCPPDGEPVSQPVYEAYLNKIKKRFRRSPVETSARTPRFNEIGRVPAGRKNDTVLRKARVERVMKQIEKNPKLADQYEELMLKAEQGSENPAEQVE